jgi:hypothetical protein
MMEDEDLVILRWWSWFRQCMTMLVIEMRMRCLLAQKKDQLRDFSAVPVPVLGRIPMGKVPVQG